MADMLIAYFSRSGSTETVARDLAARLGADLDPIRPSTAYAGASGYRAGLWQALRRRLPDVAYEKDPSRYALVILGSPVWAGGPSAPMRSYLARNRGQIGSFAAFCVSGSGAGYAGFFRVIESLAGSKALATLSLAQRDVLGGASGAKLERFAELAGAAVARAPIPAVRPSEHPPA